MRIVGGIVNFLPLISPFPLFHFKIFPSWELYGKCLNASAVTFISPPQVSSYSNIWETHLIYFSVKLLSICQTAAFTLSV